MTMLPDIDADAYDLYERERAAREMDQRLSTFTLEHSMNSRIAELSALAPTSSDSLTNPLGTGNAPAPPPEPAAPPPPVEQPTEQLPPPPAPEPAPAAPVATAPAPATDFAAGSRGMLSGAAPSDGGGAGINDWIGGALGAVKRAGGDVQKFANGLDASLTGNDLIGNALGAANRAGADIQAFASSLAPPPAPPAPIPTPSAGGISAPAGAAPLPQGDLVDYARQQARRYGIDEDVFVRQIQQESGFKNTARSGAGAIGIAQFMPQTAQGMGIDPTDPYQALEGAARLNAQNLQKYGTYDKMLAAYNAGGGAVDKYGGVPPFEETQRYVSTILGGVKDKIGGAVSAVGGAVRGGLNQISQFGDSQLTADEAYSACGPAAAVRFAQLYGRNPTLREATDLAKTVGWTSGSGMAGLTSEAALMAKMGVPVKMVGADWQVMAREAQSGNPVTISTPGHYFTADGYDPTSGAFHVGRSGTDLKGGSEWMTPAQMEARMGKVQGGLLADNPGVPSPSIADADSNPVSYLGRMKDTLTSSITDGGPALTDIKGHLTSAATGRPDDTYMSTMQAASVGEPTALTPPTPEASQSPGDRLKSAFSDFIDSVGGAKDAVGSALGSAAGNVIASPGGGLPAASQPTPSDSLTNPLGYKPAQSDILPRIESAVAENQANPPLKPFADELAKQPVTLPGQIPLPGNPNVGDVLGSPLLRGPMLQSSEDLLHSREAATARDMLEQMRRTELSKGIDSPPVTDQDVAEAARSLMIGQAVGGTHVPGEGISPSALARRAPRLSEGAVPATGAGQMAQAFEQLAAYPAWVRSGIEDFVSTMRDAPPSEVARTVYRWMEDHPPTDMPVPTSSAEAAAQADHILLQLDAAMPGGGGGGMPRGPQRGQLGLEDNETIPYGPKPRGTEALAEGPQRGQLGLEGGDLPYGGPKPGGSEALAEGPQPGQLAIEPGREGIPWQIEMPQPSGTFRPEMLLPDYKPKTQLEAERIAQIKQRLEEIRGGIDEARARRAASGEADVPLTGLEAPDLPGFRQPALKLPVYVNKEVKELLEAGNQSVGHDQPVSTTMLEDLSRKTGEKVERMRKVWKPGDEGDRVLRSIDKALDESSKDLAQAHEILKQNPDNGDALADMVRQLTRHQALQETAGARRPEAASVLSEMKNTVAGRKAVDAQIDDMAKRAKTTSEEYGKWLAKADLTDKWGRPDAAKIGSLAKVAARYTFADKATAYWYFNLLSDPLTHVRNIVGNTLTTGTTPIEQLEASALDPIARKILGDKGPRQRYAGEALAQLAGWKDAAQNDLLPTVTSTLKYGASSKSGELGRLTREPFAGKLEIPEDVPLVGGRAVGDIPGLFGRALEAEDQGFGAFNRAADLRAQAYRQASQEGKKGQARWDRVAELVSSPEPEMLESAQKMADYRGFRQLDRAAAGLNAMSKEWPGMKGIMPFVRVPINIAKYTLERSPVGGAKIAWDLARDRPGMQAKGAGDLADRMSRATLGSMVMGGLYQYAEGGNLTGRAPKDPNERAQWEREGKTPYSFKTPFGWQSYEALQPFAALIATAADAQDAVQRGDRDDKDFGAIGTAAAFALARGLVNTQFTQGLTDTLDLLQDKGASSENIGLAVTRQAGQMASNLVPMAGGLRAVARMTDDVIRDPKDEGWEGITDRMQMGIPGRQENVPEAVGAFGETRHRVSSGLSALINPSPLSQPVDDPVEAELKRLQGQQSGSLPKKLGNYTVEPGFVGKDITIGDRVAVPVELSEDQRRWYQRESGRLSYSILSGKIGTDEWNAMSDLEKAAEVEDIYSDARKVARKMLEKPEVGLVDQAMEGLMQGLRQRKARTQSQAPAQTTGG